MKLKNNYHTHTARCGHATGLDEEYVLKAIEIGIEELGFSDHCPFEGVSQPFVRMDYSRLDEYITSINLLKEKYKDKIKIYVGLEAEYYSEVKDYYKSLLNKLDYLICGQHFALDDNRKLIYSGYETNNKAVVVDYVNRVIEAIESGFFKYIAHPDLILNAYTYRDEFIEGQMRRICEASEKRHVPLEINLEGINKQVKKGWIGKEYFYPFDYFWNIVKDYSIDVVIGADIHHPEDFLRDYDKYGYDIASRYNLHLINKIDIEDKK